MSEIVKDPFDIQTKEEFESLTQIVCGKIKFLLHRKFYTSRPGTTASAHMMKDYLFKILFKLHNNGNKLDEVLEMMGADDDDEETSDAVAFIREYMVRFAGNDSTLESTLYTLKEYMR